jgi:hypothetical protein
MNPLLINYAEQGNIKKKLLEKSVFICYDEDIEILND